MTLNKKGPANSTGEFSEGLHPGRVFSEPLFLVTPQSVCMHESPNRIGKGTFKKQKYPQTHRQDLCPPDSRVELSRTMEEPLFSRLVSTVIGFSHWSTL